MKDSELRWMYRAVVMRLRGGVRRGGGEGGIGDE